jgi:hypothetical protein
MDTITSLLLSIKIWSKYQKFFFQSLFQGLDVDFNIYSVKLHDRVHPHILKIQSVK